MTNDSSIAVNEQGENQTGYGDIQVYGSYAPLQDPLVAQNKFGIEYQTVNSKGLDQFFIELSTRRKWDFPLKEYVKKYHGMDSFQLDHRFLPDSRVKFVMQPHLKVRNKKNIFIEFYTANNKKCETIMKMRAKFDETKRDTMECEILLSPEFQDDAKKVIESLYSSDRKTVVQHAHVMKELLDFCAATPKRTFD